MSNDAIQHERNPDKIILFYCPGMCGAIREDRLFSRGLYLGGIVDVRMFDWPCRLFPLINLRDRKQHQESADRLVEMMTKAYSEHPEKRFILAGHSTGVEVALLALQQLPEQMVEQVWLMAAAVSRNYDLKPILVKTQRVVNLYSPWDWIMVKLGTMIFGTADGKFGRCAGAKSFTGPGSDDPCLEQHRFKHEWRKLGHHGGHTGPLAEEFAHRYIAPNIINWKNS